jgi:hypothetical protein
MSSVPVCKLCRTEPEVGSVSFIVFILLRKSAVTKSDVTAETSKYKNRNQSEDCKRDCRGMQGTEINEIFYSLSPLNKKKLCTVCTGQFKPSSSLKEIY